MGNLLKEPPRQVLRRNTLPPLKFEFDSAIFSGLEVLFVPAKVKVLDYDCDMFFLAPERLVLLGAKDLHSVLTRALTLLDAFNACKGSDGICYLLAQLNISAYREVKSLFDLWLDCKPLPVAICVQGNLTEFFGSPSFWTKCRRAWLVKQIEILKV